MQDVQRSRRVCSSAAGAENAKIHPAAYPAGRGDRRHQASGVSLCSDRSSTCCCGANGIETLILTGIITSGVVLFELLHSADADYWLLVVGDCCCSDGDEVSHRVLLEKVLPRQATITTRRPTRATIEAGR